MQPFRIFKIYCVCALFIITFYIIFVFCVFPRVTFPKQNIYLTLVLHVHCNFIKRSVHFFSDPFHMHWRPYFPLTISHGLSSLSQCKHVSLLIITSNVAVKLYPKLKAVKHFLTSTGKFLFETLSHYLWWTKKYGFSLRIVSSFRNTYLEVVAIFLQQSFRLR